jgi:hypothetical protein
MYFFVYEQQIIHGSRQKGRNRTLQLPATGRETSQQKAKNLSHDQRTRCKNGPNNKIDTKSKAKYAQWAVFFVSAERYTFLLKSM